MMETRIARLCLEKRMQTSRIAAIPSTPVKRSMSGSAYHFQDQLALFRHRSRNPESVFDLLGSLLDIFFAGVVHPAENRARLDFLADLHFENHADRRAAAGPC